MKFGGSTAWRSITQPISNRSLSDALVDLRHIDLAHGYSRAILDNHPRDLPAPARDFHRPGSPRLQASQWHPRVARQSSIDSSARRPCLQIPQWHPRVARGASIGTLTRGPSTEVLLGQGHVPKHLPTNLKPVSCRCFGRTSARHPRREASRWHPGVAR